MNHEMGHRNIGVAWGLPPTGLFGSGRPIGNHNITRLGGAECPYIMKQAISCPGSSGYSKFKPINRAYLLQRLLLNRVFDIITAYNEIDYCRLFPGADDHYWVTAENHRASMGYYNFWPPVILEPGILSTDYTIILESEG